jgi:Mannosyl-glycoprotein endo-beta-N-acetylglucosaminidase
MSIVSFSFFTLTLFANSKFSNYTVQSYISKYRLIAQLESYRSGIPASIILAQAILESGFGNSNLCKRSKNHFGIKWKGVGDGDFVYSMDDDYNDDGKHIPSKFISYGNDIQSFHHHTDYLLRKENYKSLFRYNRSDFTNWAYGLRTCGYSTDKNYGVQLIVLIRQYALNNFDMVGSSKKNIRPLEDTKMLVSILAGKTLWSILLDKQSFILEKDNMAFAKDSQLKQYSYTLTSSKIPLIPFDATNIKKDFNFIACLRNRFVQA